MQDVEMSLSCPTSPVYRTSVEQKRRAREAAKKRCGTPKALRDLLREKCRIRLREARQCAYQKTRKLKDCFNVEEILRQELAELEKDVDLQEVIYDELKTEANEWFAEQLEEEQNYLIEVGESQQVICPVCQKSVLELSQLENIYVCSCGTSFLYPGSSTQLQSILEKRVDEHEQRCRDNLIFFVEPYLYGSEDGVNVLSVMCDSCDYFQNVFFGRLKDCKEIYYYDGSLAIWKCKEGIVCCEEVSSE